MAQDPQNPQVPGEDVLLDTLRRSRLTDNQRQTMWDAYHTQGKEEDFVGSLRKLDVNDDVRQTLYDMRYKGFKNMPSNTQASTIANLDTQAPAKGDVRPSAQATQDAKAQEIERSNRVTSAFWGRMIPDAAVPALTAANKYLVEPFEKMSQAGGKAGGFLARGVTLGQGELAEQLKAGEITPEQYKQKLDQVSKDFPKTAGVSQGIGEFVGGTASDPRMWPFALEGAAKGAISELAAKGFTTQMLLQAATTIPAAKEAIKRGDVYEASRLITTGVAAGVLGSFGLADDKPSTTKEASVKQGRDTRKGIDPDLNTRVRQSLARPQTSTPLGPISATGGQNAHIDFTTKAPVEAQAPVATNGASKSANAPTIDRQALVAPNPADFVGKDTPVPSYRFPAGTLDRMAKGGTQGLGKVDLSSKVAEVIAPNGSQTREVMAQTPSVSRGASTGAEAALPPELHADLEKQAGRKLAPQEAVALDRSNMERGMAGGIGKADESSAIREQKRAQLEKPDPNRYAPKTSFQQADPVAALHSTFHDIANLNRDADLAESNEQSKALTDKHDQLEAETMNKLRQLSLTKAHAEAFSEQADRLEAQSKGIRDLTEATIKNRGVKAEIADLRSQGGPVREMVINPETGERGVVKPEDRTSRGVRSILDEAQGRVPTSEFNSLEVAGKPEGVSDEEWASHISKLQEERQGLKKKISDAVIIASDTGSSIYDQGIHDHIAKLKEIESILGRYVKPAETGRRSNLPVELDKNGAIKATEPLKAWTWARVQAVFGGKFKQIPTDEEFFQEADHFNERGRLFRAASDVASEVAKRDSQRGAIGEGKLKGEVKPVSLADRVPSDDEIMKRAKAAGQFTFKTDMDFPAGRVGLLSRDGGTWVDSGHISHDYLAELLLPEVSKNGSALRAMLDKGWIRKASPIDYEVWNLDSKALKTIETDLNRSGRYGQEITLDTRNSLGAIKPITVENGWGDRFNTLEDAVNAAKRKQGWTSDTGVIKGTTLAASSAVGGILGTVVGAHLGEPFLGGAIGWGAGFIAPAIVDHPAFWNTINSLKPGITNLGIKMTDWLKGPKQLDIGDPTMESILDAQQRDIKGPTKSLITRLAQIPGDLYVGHNKFAFLNDQTGRVFPAVMKLLGDDRGRQFYDLRGKLDVENSPYVSTWLAAGGGGGAAEAHLLDYKKMVTDTQSKGLTKYTNAYLNLKRYQQVYDVMTERIQDADQTIQKLNQALQQPKLPVEVEAGMRKALREAKVERQDIVDKLVSKTLVPQPYDPPKIASTLSALQARLGPRFQEVEASANKLYDMNRKVLDMLHDEGIVSDLEYQKYAARSNGYIPMHRILEQISDNTGKTNGTSSPLYLRQQNVIKALMGSDKINRDPIIASADANLEALKEVARNKVAREFHALAQADPGVGSLVKEVRSGHKAAPDKGLIGFYENGMTRTFEVPSWLSESLKNVSPASQDIIGKGPLQYFGRILRQGATLGNLAWSVPNALRHLGDMAIMSEGGIQSIKTLPKDVAGLLREWTKSFYSAAVNDPVRQEFLRSGASYSTLQSMISPEEKLDLNTLGFKQKVAQGRIIDTVADFNKTVEEATKMTTYKRLRQAGYSEKNAAWETRRFGGGPDFAVQGNMSQALGMASMFYNAHLQYVSRVFVKAAENPMRVAVALGAITAMAMTLNEWNYNQKDEKGNLLMRKVPNTERENYFVVLTGDTYKDTGMPIKILIPKPSFAKFLYNPIENTINKMDGHEERTGTQLGLQALANLIPGQTTIPTGEGMTAGDVGKAALRGAVSSLNPILKTPIEEAMNYKTTGTGGPIVPNKQQGIESQYQFGPSTSETTKRMGEGGVRGAEAGAAVGASMGYLLAGPKGAAVGGALGGITGTFGISPRRAEHIIDSTTAGVGRMATGFVDPFLGGVNQTKMGSDKYTNLPLAGPILGRVLGSAVDQQEQTLTEQFYRDTQKAQEPLNTLNYLKKNAPEQIPAFIEKNKDGLWKGQVATTLQSRLGQLQNAEKMVQQNTSMPENERALALKNLRDIKLQVLGVFTQVLRPTTGAVAAVPGQGQGNAR